MQQTHPMTPRTVYLNTASFGRIDLGVKATAIAFYTDIAVSGGFVFAALRAEADVKGLITCLAQRPVHGKDCLMYTNA